MTRIDHPLEGYTTTGNDFCFRTEIRVGGNRGCGN